MTPLEELKRLDALIESANELAALKPIYYRLNEIIQAYPADFDVQFTGNELKQRLVARGNLLQQRADEPPPPPVAPVEPPPAPAVEPEPPPPVIEPPAVVPQKPAPRRAARPCSRLWRGCWS